MAQFELLIAMLFAIIALHYVGRRLHLPPAVALIVGGASLTLIPGLPAISLDPNLVLAIFLPPLLMDGAWFIPLRQLQSYIIGTLSLAVGAVVCTTIVVAMVTHALMPTLPWPACAALGAIVSPPDAISARAILQRVSLPHRLSIILEGESLLNDATGLVLFRVAVAAAVTGTFSAVATAGNFLVLALGGLAVGAAMGAAWVFLVRRLEDEYLIIASSVLSGWASFLVGDALHVSGVIATVTTGLVCGWYQHDVLSAAVRMRGGSFWAVLIFLLEAVVFMLIGLSLREVLTRVGGIGVVVHDMAVPILFILLALTLARFAWIFACELWLVVQNALGFERYEAMSWRGAAVLSWAGMRGVVTLAVALSVPATMPGRDFMLVTAFAVILVTVLVQGMTLGLVIGWLRPPETGHVPARLTMSGAEASMARAQFVAVEKQAYAEDGSLVHPQLLDKYKKRAEAIVDYVGNEDEYQPRLQAHFDVVLVAIAAGRAELLRLHRAGEIDDRTLHELEHDLDLEELGAWSAKAT